MKKIDFETIQNYLVGGVVGLLHLMPEAVKIIFSAFYGVLFWMLITSGDLGSIESDVGQIVAVLIILITPIGAHYFYSKTIFSELLPELIKWLSQYTSITFETKTSQNTSEEATKRMSKDE